MTPAPEIKSKTWQQEEIYTFTRTGTSTSFWTESQAVQTSSTTVTGSSTTWMDGGKPGQTDCHDCENKGSPPPSTVTAPTATSSGGPQLAWTQTTAPGGPAAQSGAPNGSGNALASQGVGWMGSPQVNGAGASPSGMGTPAMAQAGGNPLPNGSGVPSFNSQGTAIPPRLGANPAGLGAGAPNSPFASAGFASPRSLGSSELLLASTLMVLVCSAVLL